MQMVMGMCLVPHLGYYLGLPSAVWRNRNRDFKAIKDRVWRVIQAGRKILSLVGRKEVSIKSVAQPIPTYVMSSFI